MILRNEKTGPRLGGWRRDERPHPAEHRSAGQLALECSRASPDPSFPDAIAPLAFLVIECREKNRALSLVLAADLAIDGHLVGFDGQEHDGPRGVDAVISEAVAPMKNARLV